MLLLLKALDFEGLLDIFYEIFEESSSEYYLLLLLDEIYSYFG